MSLTASTSKAREANSFAIVVDIVSRILFVHGSYAVHMKSNIPS